MEMKLNEVLANFILDTITVHWMFQVIFLMTISLAYIIFWRIFMDIFDYFKFYRYDKDAQQKEE